MRAIVIEEFGGPSSLRLVDTDRPRPGPGQLSVAVDSAGINYLDTLVLDDAYPPAAGRLSLPVTPGIEVVGRTETGRRVVALTSTGRVMGGYADYIVTEESLIHDVPDTVSDSAALAIATTGLTAWHLLRTAGKLSEGESVAVQSAAGSTGSLVVQLARLFGAGRIIGTASSPEKRDLLHALGVDAAIDSSPEGLTERLVEANRGELVDIVLEATGGATFDASLEAVAPFGRLVVYGVASGELPAPVDVVSQLAGRGRTIAGFYLGAALDRREMFHDTLDELFALVEAGHLTPQTASVYPLAEAAQAHEDLRSRRTVGKLILDVSGEAFE